MQPSTRSPSTTPVCTTRTGSVLTATSIAMTTLSFEHGPGNAGLGDTAAFYEADLTVPVGEHAEHGRRPRFGFSMR